LFPEGTCIILYHIELSTPPPREFAVRTLLVGLLLGCWTLSASAAADVSLLVKNLESKDNEVRRKAAEDLKELGKDAKDAVPALTKALKDSDSFVRRFSAQALGSIGIDARSAVPALSKLLDDGKEPVRQAAVKALGKMGPDGVAALSKAVVGETFSSDVQLLAISSLGESGSEGVPALVKMIGNTKADAGMRRRALEAVLPLGEKAHDAVVPLTAVVKDPRNARGREAGQFRIDAVRALGTLATPSDKAAVKVLDDIVKDEKLRNNQLKNTSKQALKMIMSKK
jgi:HEAT repeat protein